MASPDAAFAVELGSNRRLWYLGRHFVVLTDTNALTTLRQEPMLALIQPQLAADGASFVLEAPGMNPLTICLSDVAGNDAVPFK